MTEMEKNFRDLEKARYWLKLASSGINFDAADEAKKALKEPK